MQPFNYFEKIVVRLISIKFLINLQAIILLLFQCGIKLPAIKLYQKNRNKKQDLFNKQNARLLDSLRNTKSTLRSTNFSRTIYRPSPARPRAIKAQRDQEVNQQNKKFITKLLSLKKCRSYSVLNKVRQSTPLIKQLQNSKRRLVQIRQKQLQSENKKMLDKILNINSNLKDIRIKLHKNPYEDKQRNRAIVALSTNASIHNSQKKIVRHSKTQTIQPPQVDNQQKGQQKQKNYTSIQEQVGQQTHNDQGIQEVIE